MLIKLFFLAAASAMLMVYQMSCNSWTPRKPASTTNYQTICYAPGYPQGFPCTPPQVYPQIPASNQQFSYSYRDFESTFSTAIMEENMLRQNMLNAQGMLASEEQRLASTQMTVYEQANPYHPSKVTISKLKNEIEKMRLMRHNNLDRAYLRLYLTYASIQVPLEKDDKRNSLNLSQHQEAKKKLEFILALKQAVQLDGTPYGIYPSSSPYMTAGLNPPELVAPPIVLPAETPKIEVPQPAPLVVEAPKVEEKKAEPPPGSVEAVLEDPSTTIQ